MRLLHTSDWHIGQTLYAKKRHEEHTGFLSWLKETIQKRQIDALIVSGDVFDTGAPGGAIVGDAHLQEDEARQLTAED